MIVEVYINRAAIEINKSFDYHVPYELESLIELGQRIFVPFGKSKEIGYVTKIKDISTFDGLKDIISIIDISSLINERNIELAKAISNHYFTSFAKTLELMIPTGLRQTIKKKYIINDLNKLDDDLKKYISNNILDVSSISKNLIKELLNKNIIEEYYCLETKGSIKKEANIKYICDYFGKSNDAKNIISYLKEINELVKKQDLIELGYNENSLKTLVNNKCVEIVYKETYHDLYIKDMVINKVSLNEEQLNAYNAIKENYDTNSKYLLYGVCGSGKTEIYLNLIEDVIKSGKQAIMLVPEISLTPQMATRFKSRFNDNIALLHSKLSVNERYDQYRRIKRREANVIIGARSALFSPVSDLGIIIMDEEQESSYIQDSSPRYDSHYVASLLSDMYNCPLVLGSATPSVNTMYQAFNKKYKLLVLEHKANNRKEEDSIIVDMRDELRKGNKTVFSEELRNSILNTYQAREQSILFLNRRGFSTHVECRDCGETIKCPNCDVTLTYHKSNNTLLCHYCGYKIPSPSVCPCCKSKRIKDMGNGTEKVEEELSKLLPEARILRMDQDTLKTKNSHADIIDAFNKHEADVLLGTQSVAKGLDFPLVSLVGVVNADIGLFNQTYDSYEKTFDLIEQVSGRAGRKDTSSKCVIQTYNPTNLAIEKASKHSYLDFYQEEIKRRKLSNNPPFSSLIEVLFESSDSLTCYKEAKNSSIYLSKDKNITVLGPVSDKIFKLKNKFRYVLTLKGPVDYNYSCLLDLVDKYISLNNIDVYITRK